MKRGLAEDAWQKKIIIIIIIRISAVLFQKLKPLPRQTGGWGVRGVRYLHFKNVKS